MSASQKDYAKANQESAQGTAASNMEEMKAKAYEAKAAVRETFGYDATDDRAEASKHRATGKAKEIEHGAKSTAYQAKGKVEEKLGQ